MSEILVSRQELEAARGWAGRVRGYLPHRWPSWFDPVPLDLGAQRVGPFMASTRLTADGAVVAVATPGHPAGHVSVLAQDGDVSFFLAGDTSYNEALMLAGQADGVSADEGVARATLGAIQHLARAQPTVYLPMHDPQSGARLARKVKAVSRAVGDR